jgi:hypothetical protein
MLVIVGDPHVQRSRQLEGARPFLEPETRLCERAHHPLNVRVALGVVLAGEGLMHPQRVACLHECHRGRLTAVVAHQREAFLARAVRELAVHGHVQGGQPLVRPTLQAGMVPHNGLGLPVEHDDEIYPTKAFHQDFGHIDAPSLVGLHRFRHAPHRRPLGFELHIGADQQVVLPHQPQHSLLVHRPLLHEPQVGPEPAIAPKRVLGLQCLDTREQAGIPLHDPERSAPTHQSTSALFFNSKSSSPTRAFNRAFSRARWAAF